MFTFKGYVTTIFDPQNNFVLTFIMFSKILLIIKAGTVAVNNATASIDTFTHTGLSY